MLPRQRLALRIAAVLALLTAALHLYGQSHGFESTVPAEQEMIRQATTVRMQLPGGTERTLMDFVDGFGLIFTVFLGVTAAMAFLVARRAPSDPALANAIARMLAAAYIVLTVVSLAKFFIVPTICIAAVGLALIAAIV